MPASRATYFFALASMAIGFAAPAFAQTIAKPGAAPVAKADNSKSTEAANAFASGTKAFESGKIDAAVAALSTAISSGGLKNSDLAKAMFYRGVAYRKQKKPGAALSDLNAAVWLRDGLSATDKAVAEDHRQALLREVAGLDGSAPASTPSAAAPVEVAAPSIPVAPVELKPSIASEQASQSATAPVARAAPEPAALPWVTAPNPSQVAPPQTQTAEVAAPSPIPPAALPKVEDDTVTVPVANVAPVERAAIATVQAEPAPPVKPLPWQMETNPTPPVAAEQSSEPPSAAAAASETTTPKEPASTAIEAAAPVAPAAPRVEATPTPEPTSSSPSAVSPSSLDKASTALADAGKAAGALLGSFFGGGASTSGEPTQAAESSPNLVQKDEPAPPLSPGIQTVSLPDQSKSADAPPAVWQSETKTAPVPPAEVRVASAEAAPSADAPPPVAVLPRPSTTGEPTQAAKSSANLIQKDEPAAPLSARVETASLPDQSKSKDAPPVVWQSETKTAPVAAAAPAPVLAPEVRVATAEAAPSADAPPPVAVLPGPYRLQIAAENSRADAEQTLSRLVAGYKPSLRGIEPVIEEPATGGVLFGSMGAAYRVSLGPYTTSVEPGRLCNILKPHGFDCRVVAVQP